MPKNYTLNIYPKGSAIKCEIARGTKKRVMEVADIITLHFTSQGLLADLEELQLQLATMGFIEVLKSSSMEIIEHEEVLLSEDLTEEV